MSARNHRLSRRNHVSLRFPTVRPESDKGALLLKTVLVVVLVLIQRVKDLALVDLSWFGALFLDAERLRQDALSIRVYQVRYFRLLGPFDGYLLLIPLPVFLGEASKLPTTLAMRILGFVPGLFVLEVTRKHLVLMEDVVLVSWDEDVTVLPVRLLASLVLELVACVANFDRVIAREHLRNSVEDVGLRDVARVPWIGRDMSSVVVEHK